MPNRITSFQVGLESLSHLSLDSDQGNALPARHQLQPDGAPVQAHLDQLFDIHPARRLLQMGIRPRISDPELLRPDHYRQLFSEIRNMVKSGAVTNNQERGQALEQLFDEMQADHLWLSISFMMLIKA